MKESGVRLAPPTPRRQLVGAQAAPRKSLRSRLLGSIPYRRAAPTEGDGAGAGPAKFASEVNAFKGGRRLSSAAGGFAGHTAEAAFLVNAFDVDRSIGIFPEHKGFAQSTGGSLVLAPGRYLPRSKSNAGMPSFKAMIGFMRAAEPGPGTDMTKAKAIQAAPLVTSSAPTPTSISDMDPDTQLWMPGHFDAGLVSAMRYAKAEARIAELVREVARERAGAEDVRVKYGELAAREFFFSLLLCLPCSVLLVLGVRLRVITDACGLWLAVRRVSQVAGVPCRARRDARGLSVPTVGTA